MKSLKWLVLMIFATFSNKDLSHESELINGFSWRKIAGLAGLITAINVTFQHISPETYLSTLYAWQVFVSVCIGLITIPELLKALTSLKNNKE